MAHEKVYGVCENKCFVEVAPKTEVDDRVSKTKIETVTGIKTCTFRPRIKMNWDMGLDMQAQSFKIGDTYSAYVRPVQFICRDVDNNPLFVLQNYAENNDRRGVDLTMYDKNGSAVTLGLKSDGTNLYATAPTWSAGTNSNDNKILTINMVNSLPSVVHTTGSEPISGDKIFSSNLYIKASAERGTVITRTDKALGDTWCRYKWDRAYDKNSFLMGDVLITSDASSVSHSIGAFNKTSDGTSVTSRLTVYAMADGTVFANAPETRATGYGKTNIATAGWVDDKIKAIKSETWTFTLEDGSTVTKKVLVG